MLDLSNENTSMTDAEIMPAGLKDESDLTEDEQKARRILEFTGEKKYVRDLVKEEVAYQTNLVEVKRVEKEAEEAKQENPVNIEDIPAFRGGVFTKRKVSDRELSSAVRRLTLKKIFNLLCKNMAELAPAEQDLYSKVLVKLAGAVLPRIQEITSEEGEMLTIHISKEIADKNNIDSEVKQIGDSGSDKPLDM